MARFAVSPGSLSWIGVHSLPPIVWARRRPERSGWLWLLPRLELLGLDPAHHEATVRKLERFRGHKLTHVDASSLVFLQEYHVREIWGTDRDLALEGARVIPAGR